MSQISVRAIQLEQFGNPKEVRLVIFNIFRFNISPKKIYFQVLELKPIQINTNLQPDEVLVKWLAAPVNPTDINKIQGDYVNSFFSGQHEFPIIPGSEGTGVVEKV